MVHGGEHALGENTAEDFLQGTFTPIEEDPRIAQCKADGGNWNTETKTCDFTLQQKVEKNIAAKELEAKKAEEEAIKEDTGRDITFNPDGTVTVIQGGVSEIFTRDEYKDILAVQRGEARSQDPRIIRAAQTQGELQQQQQQQQFRQQLGQLGQVGQFNPNPTEADIDWGQAFTAGLAGVLPGLAVGFIGTAGNPFGIAAGIVGGYMNSVRGNIKSQQSGEIGAANLELSNARTSMRQLALLASRDPSRAVEYIASYNALLTRVHQARAQLKAEVSGNLNKWMSDGRRDLAAFDLFLSPQGEALLYKQKLEINLLKDVPVGFSEEDAEFFE